MYTTEMLSKYYQILIVFYGHWCELGFFNILETYLRIKLFTFFIPSHFPYCPNEQRYSTVWFFKKNNIIDHFILKYFYGCQYVWQVKIVNLKFSYFLLVTTWKTKTYTKNVLRWGGVFPILSVWKKLASVLQWISSLDKEKFKKEKI